MYSRVSLCERETTGRNRISCCGHDIIRRGSFVIYTRRRCLSEERSALVHDWRVKNEPMIEKTMLSNYHDEARQFFFQRNNIMYIHKHMLRAAESQSSRVPINFTLPLCPLTTVCFQQIHRER